MNIPDIARSLQSAKTSSIIRVMIALFVLIVVFWMGVTVGWRKAEFSYRFSDNYYRSFGGHERSPIGKIGMPDPDDLINGHGAVGKVISVNLPTVIVSDANGVEKSIRITNDTVVRSGRGGIASTTITDHDFIVVIGNPDTTGLITAKLIRVMPPPPAFATTSLPTPQ
ncbi:MAG: hypothetical protein KBC33_00235 [Candidatus Pacebacteria bacterium]|nr:hypothetical protein [Candidatus Paceibacterota bacterium]